VAVLDAGSDAPSEFDSMLIDDEQETEHAIQVATRVLDAEQSSDSDEISRFLLHLRLSTLRCAPCRRSGVAVSSDARWTPHFELR
jgi:hypothetical protein